MRVVQAVAVAALFALCASQEAAVHQEQPAATHTVDKGDRGSVIVKEFLIDSDVEDIQWAGKTNKIVYVRSVLGTLYRSGDDGKTWEYQMTKLRGSLVEEADGKTGIAEILVSEADRDYAFFRGHGDTHWVTRDGGQTYDMLAGGFPIKQAMLHKTEPEYILASRWSMGCKAIEVKQNCSVEVHLSLDFGRSWSYLENYVAQFGWGRQHRSEEIFIVRFEKMKGNQRFGAWDKEADFFKSDDLWKTNTKLIPHGNRFLMLDKYLFVAMVNPDRENEVQLVVGKEDQIIYEIGRLPFELKEHSYTILDTSEGAVFLHVNHGDFSTPYGNIYLSDADGWRYALSLKNNRRDVRGRCDFEKVQGLEGIYIANYVENPEFLDSWGEREHVVTVMTFDKGGRWSRIKAPSHDAEGRDTDCALEEGCSLHLHGVTDEWGPFYSTKSALGLIMATGNTGKYLDMSHGGNVNTYFSRDAGQSWYEVRRGSHIYEFGDHGALMVMAKDRESTREVLYTWNEGMTWKSVTLPAMTDVDNIITEPNSTSPAFVLYGSRNGVGVLTHLDFSELHVKQCEGIEAAGKAQSAYELWSPTDGVSKCLLGRQVHYTRRKRAEECFNGEQYERKVLLQNCPCTEMDYECDYGYERQGLDGPCSAIKAISTDVPAQCPPGGEYTISKGYRLVAGDTCDASKGVNHMPEVISCPTVFGTVTSNGWTVLLLLFVLGAALLAVTYLNKDPEALERLRGWMSDTKIKYKKLDMKPDAFSDDDDFDLGEDMDDDPDAEMLHDTNLHNFGADQGESAFGPLPGGSNFEEAEVPALQPPPAQAAGSTSVPMGDVAGTGGGGGGSGGDASGDVFSALADQEDALFNNS